MKIKFLALATVMSLAFTAFSANAAVITINFDNLSAGTVVGSNYSTQGVTFSNATVGSFSGLPGVSGTKAILATSGGTQPQPSTAISAMFSAPASSVSLTGIDVGVNGFLLNAYDAVTGGNLIDSEQIFGTGIGSSQFFTLTVTGADIYRVQFSQVKNVASDGIVFDNFSFTPATVPEPTTIALLGLGLLGFAASRRKLANSKNA